MFFQVLVIFRKNKFFGWMIRLGNKITFEGTNKSEIEEEDLKNILSKSNPLQIG